MDKQLLGAECVNSTRPDLRVREFYCAGIKYCDTTTTTTTTTTENPLANSENTPYPKHKRIALLTAKLR
ncbi:MAG: hypothetical protein U0936_26910 [Planctomycetaceae bacterium]